ncbi:hypothetical protein [Falsiroseomonas sp. E2-1-a20]|uniref:hypothetical protein n=1 Tax=Falsiroseomonas sp. E2-1-a20 TaxID=3239300 RepID=UPI003F2B27BA
MTETRSNVVPFPKVLRRVVVTWPAAGAERRIRDDAEREALLAWRAATPARRGAAMGYARAVLERPDASPRVVR